MHILNSKQKRAIQEELEEIYGITEIPYLLVETGKQKIRAFSGSLSREEIFQLAEIARIEVIGMYLVSKKDEDARLNFDAVSLFRNQIKKNIVEIDKPQLDLWLRGYDLEISCPRGITLLKFQNDLVGVGKSNTEKIFNYVPKERKLKTPLPSN